MPALGFQVQERNGDLVVTLGDCASASPGALILL